MIDDTVCTLVPYFDIHPGNEEAFRALVPEFIAASEAEPGCMHYAFSFSGNSAHCREGYDNAESILAHLANVDALLQQALQLADLAKLEVHAPIEEVAKLREPLAGLNPQFYELAGGFRR